MVAKSIAKMYTNIHKPTDYCTQAPLPSPVMACSRPTNLGF